MTLPGPDPVLYVLVLEDNSDDAELMLRELRRSGFTPRAYRVQNQPEYVGALDAGYAPGQPWDVILADYTLPDYSGQRALQLLRERGTDLPFIVVSGTVGEGLALQIVQEGASDYVLKDRLMRLGPAVKRAVEERRLRQSQRQAEDNYYRLFENSLAGIYQSTPNGQLLTANPALARMLGYDTPAHLIANLGDLGRQSYVDPDHRAEFIRRMADRDVVAGFESELYRKDGSTIWVSENARAVRDAQGELLFYEGIIEDITERKRSDEALRASEQRYRAVSELASDFAYAVRVEPNGELVPEWVTEAFTRVTGFTLAEVDLAGGWPTILHPDDIPAFIRRGQALLSGRSDVTEYRTRTKSGAIRWLRDSGRPVWDVGQQRVIRILGAAQDITERKQAEQDQQRRAEQFALLYEAGLVLNSALDARTQLETVFDVATKALRASRADFFRYDKILNELHLDLAYHYEDERVPKALRNLSFPLGQEKGLVGLVGQQRQSLYVPDVTLDSRWTNLDTEIRSALWVPLQREKELLGVLCLLSPQSNAFSDDDQRFLELIANQVAVALENARLFAEAHQRLAELEAVNQVSKALRSAQTLDEMLPVWLDVTLAVTQATGGSIWLYDAAKDELRPAVVRGWNDSAGAGPVQPQKPGVGVNGYVFVTGQPYVSSNFQVDPHLAEGTRERIPPGGGAGIPIRVEDQVIGTFIVNVPPGRDITPDEIHLLTILAEIAGTAIQRTRLFLQTNQRLSQLSALRAIDLAITASLDLRITLAVFLEHVVAQLNVDAADVLLLDPSDQSLAYAAGRGFRTHEFQSARIRAGEGRAGRVVLERRIIVSDLKDEHGPSKRTGLLAHDAFVSYVGVPLTAKGQVLGALEIFHRSPLDPAPEWLEYLSALSSQAAIALDNAALFNNLQRSNTDLRLAYDATIEGWSRALDLRDRETEGHSQRVTTLTEQLAAVLGMPENQIVPVRWGALLHDIGKMGVPDYILLKPGPLSDDEWTIMRQHPAYAYDMLAPIQYLRQALEIPYCHHEKWNGTGYPRGLQGEAIPLSARMFAVVDVWDALCSDRPYRRAWPAEKVRDYIREQAGKYFDPAVVVAFLKMNVADRK